MSAEQDLLAAYREWRRLAEAEKEAICARNWGLLAAFQAALKNICGRVTGLAQAARIEWAASGCDRAAKEREVAAVVRELAVLEHRNQTLINAMREAAQARLQELNQAGHNLQRLKQSYAFAPPTGWSSFS